MLPKTDSTKFTIDDADVDMYSLALVAGDQIQVRADALVGSGLDARLRLFDAAGHELASDDNTNGFDPALNYTVSTSGTYYFGVSGSDNSTYDPTTGAGVVPASTGDYDVSVRVDSATPVTTEVEPNNSPSTPNVIQIIGNSSVAGTIGTVGDVDVFMFTVASGRFTSQVVADPGSPLDARLTLLGADGRVWQTSDDQSVGNVNPLVSQRLAAGTYFLKVEGSRIAHNGAAATGDYHLTSSLASGDPAIGPHDTSSSDQNQLGVNPVAIAVGDFNGDGISDFVTANASGAQTGNLSIILGTGDSSYLAPLSVSFPPGHQVVGVVTGDFNGDHKLDLAVVDQSTGTLASSPVPGNVFVLFGAGNGTFSLPTTIPVGDLPTAITTADFNRDGFADLAVTNELDGTVSLLLGRSDGTFNSGGTFNVGLQPQALVVGDFNGDQRPDLAVANQQSNDVSVLLNNSAGGFLPQRRFGVGSRPTALAVANFNGDAFTDLVVANAGSQDVSVLYGTGSGRFNPQLRLTIQVGSASQSGSGSNLGIIAAADFNGDGLADLAVADASDSRVSVALGTGKQDVPFKPAQQFSNDTRTVYESGNLSEPSAVVVGDFNGDGRLDFATADGFGNHISVYSGLGDGRFVGVTQLQAGTEPRALVVAAGNNDVNDDGHADLIAANADGAFRLSWPGGRVFSKPAFRRRRPS